MWTFNCSRIRANEFDGILKHTVKQYSKYNCAVICNKTLINNKKWYMWHNSAYNNNYLEIILVKLVKSRTFTNGKTILLLLFIYFKYFFHYGCSCIMTSAQQKHSLIYLFFKYLFYFEKSTHLLKSIQYFYNNWAQLQATRRLSN